MLVTNDVGMGDPFFCKYLCPQGVLEGAIPLAAVNSNSCRTRRTFSWKLGILIAVVVLSVLFYRPFCKWLCPLGAFYALLNKVSLLGMKVDKHKCVSCGEMRKGLQDGCRCDKISRSRRMHPLRYVHSCLSHKCRQLPLRFRQGKGMRVSRRKTGRQ